MKECNRPAGERLLHKLFLEILRIAAPATNPAKNTRVTIGKRLEARTVRTDLRERKRSVKKQDSNSTGEYAARLRLVVEPVPKTLANKSLNNLLSWKQWKEIREREYARYNYHCGICGVAPENDRLECHEVFEYDDAARVQRLFKLIALCGRCHSVKNWGWARKAWKPGKTFAPWENEKKLEAYREGNRKVDREGNETRVALLEDHFMTINECDLKAMREHVMEESKVWERRSQHSDWWTDFGEFNQLLGDDL